MESADVAELPAANEAAQDRTVAGAEQSEQVADTKPEESVMTTSRPTVSSGHLAPPSPMLDLETDFPPGEIKMTQTKCCSAESGRLHLWPWCVSVAELLEQKPPAPQRGVKRAREGSPARKRVRWLPSSSQTLASYFKMSIKTIQF